MLPRNASTVSPKVDVGGEFTRLIRHITGRATIRTVMRQMDVAVSCWVIRALHAD